MTTYPGTVSQIVFSSKGTRCMAHPNPKRPTWRCKAAPTWMWESDDREPDGRVHALWGCDEHRALLLDESERGAA